MDPSDMLPDFGILKEFEGPGRHSIRVAVRNFNVEVRIQT